MNTTCQTETLTFFDGSSTLFGWLGLVEPDENLVGEADVLVETPEDEAERVMLEAEYEQEQREMARDWAVVKSSWIRGGW